MSREWKPGEVAVIDYYDEPRIALVTSRKGAPDFVFVYADGSHDLVADADIEASARLAEVTLPKPPEPQNFAAVVVDGTGLRWVRTYQGSAVEEAYWVSGHRRSHYAAINVVRVLSDGVAP